MMSFANWVLINTLFSQLKGSIKLIMEKSGARYRKSDAWNVIRISSSPLQMKIKVIYVPDNTPYYFFKIILALVTLTKTS